MEKYLKSLSSKFVTPTELYKSLDFKITKHWRAKYFCRFGFHSKATHSTYICKWCGNSITQK